nr:alpha/beta hydrolase [Armatimonas sp.]
MKKQPPLQTAAPFEVERLLDIAYYEGKDADPVKQKLDLFVPKNQKGFPVMVFVHGGAWTSGDRKIYSNVGRIFAKNGVGTAVISYRLSPKMQHPAHIQDVARAFAWVHKNIAKHGGRPDRLFVTGQSAGGHLAALLATNEIYLKAEGLHLNDIRGAMPISGIYTFRPGGMPQVIGTEPGAAESASPLNHVTKNVPPFLILYADKDFPGCDTMSKALFEALKKNAIEATCTEIKDRTHISIMLSILMNETDPSTQALLEFIAKHSELKLTKRISD